MENNTVLSELLNYAFQALLLVITGLVIPWLKSKVGVARFEKTALFICSAVKSAEQIYGSKAGSDKLEYVINQLRLKGIKIDETVLSQIESAVFENTNNTINTMVTASSQDTTTTLNS